MFIHVCILHYSTDPKDRTWNFALEDYHVFMKKLQCLKGSVSVSGIPDYVLKVRALSVVNVTYSRRL